jgi:tight adherence protein C
MPSLFNILLYAAAGLFFIGVAVVVITVAAASFGRIGVARSLRAIDKVYAAGSAGPQDEAFGDRMISPVKNRVTKIGRAATPAGAVSRLRRWLDYAGNPGYWSVERIFELKGLGLLVLGFVGVVVGIAVQGGAVGAAVGGVLGAVIGFYVPDVIVYDLGERRQAAIRRHLPDVMDTMSVSVEAGLGFDAAVAQVTRYGKGPVAGEFARVLQEMQLGVTRVDALRALGKRTSVTELRSFCATTVQATELGLPIASVLREQSKEMRIRRRQRAEELAQKVPVKILFPLVFCLFPSLFIVVIGPGVINIMRVFF